MSSGHFCWWLLDPWSKTCFIDMESTAAWVQAIVSGLAIWFTAYLYKDQIKENNDFKLAENEKNRNQQLLRLKHFSLQMKATFSNLKKVITDHPNIHNYRNIKTIVDENLLWSRDFELKNINEDELALFLALRMKTHGVSTWLEEYLAKGDDFPIGSDYVISVMDAAKPQLDFFSKIV